MPPRRRNQVQQRGTKKAFVLSLPEVPTAEVVKRAKAQGIKLNAHQVSNIRWNAKQESAVVRGPKLRTSTRTMTTTKVGNPNAALSVSGATSPATTKRAALKKLMVDMGLDASQEILDELRVQLNKSV